MRNNKGRANTRKTHIRAAQGQHPIQKQTGLEEAVSLSSAFSSSTLATKHFPFSHCDNVQALVMIQSRKGDPK
ncbi:uncharacterized protein V6R79_021103, partial [Siganus canaliculatus]